MPRVRIKITTVQYEEGELKDFMADTPEEAVANAQRFYDEGYAELMVENATVKFELAEEQPK